MNQGIKILFLVSSFFLSQVSYSQVFNGFGFSTGINYGESVIKETFSTNGVDFNYATDEADVAVNLGMLVRIKVSKFIFQPQLLASNHNTTMRLSAPNFDSIFTLNQNRFDIPLLFGYAPTKSTRLLLGPVYTKMLSHKITSDSFYREEVNTLFQGGSWGLQLGFGFDIGRLVIDCKYETSLGRIAESATIKDYTFDFDQRNNTVQVMLGYNFIK